ncbi:MAG: DNA repair and recombination protein RadB [Nanoarchaeota archaeon]|nr:DNA repair and recombination protein RadB [Nanoarchaeota archaeon]
MIEPTSFSKENTKVKLISNSGIDVILPYVTQDTITTVYGPPASGKTTLVLQYALQSIKEGKKVIYVDTEGGFSVERFYQLGAKEEDLSSIIHFTPKSFEEQQRTILQLNRQIRNDKNIGLIIIDSLVMLYRLKLGDAPQKINTELGEQLRMLTELSRNFNIAIIATNQMYQDFESKETKMVGGNVIHYWSKTIVELTNEGLDKKAILKKHKFIESGKEIMYSIKNEGIVAHKSKGFGFFK